MRRATQPLYELEGLRFKRPEVEMIVLSQGIRFKITAATEGLESSPTLRGESVRLLDGEEGMHNDAEEDEDTDPVEDMDIWLSNPFFEIFGALPKLDSHRTCMLEDSLFPKDASAY